MFTTALKIVSNTNYYENKNDFKSKLFTFKQISIVLKTEI